MMQGSSSNAAPRALLAAAALLIAACGGEDKGRPSADIVNVPAIDQCALPDQYELQPIVTFEPRTQSNGKPDTRAYCDADVPCETGVETPFYFNYDKNHSEPLPNNLTPEMLPTTCPEPPAPTTFDVSNMRDVDQFPRNINGKKLDAPRCGVSENALEITIKDLAMCVGPNGRLGWGAGLDLNFSKAQPFDASEWDGISFWVRRSGNGASAFVFSVIDAQNAGIGGTFEQETSPGCGCYRPYPATAPKHWECSTDPDVTHAMETENEPGKPAYPDIVKCDPFGAEVSITDDWTFYAFEFSGLRQKGFGFASQPFDKSKLSRLQFLVQFGDWSFWLDDIALFRKKK